MTVRRISSFVLLLFLLSTPLPGIVEDQKLTEREPQPYDGFGGAISVSGRTMALGAKGRSGAYYADGAVYLFERRGKRWRETAVLTPSDPREKHHFGRSVSLDGNRLAVGTPGDVDGSFKRGSIYVFERRHKSWIQEAELHADDPEPEGILGGSVSLDGDVIVAGDRSDGSLGTEAGAAFVFERVEGTWIQTAKLTAGDGEAFDHFGESVSVSGGTIAVGMRPYLPVTDLSSVYIFEKTGGRWEETAVIPSPGGVMEDRFGRSVALDGDRLAVGAPGTTVKGEREAGCVWVFEREGAEWVARDQLTASDAVWLDFLGFAVDLDGDSIVAGAPLRTAGPVPPVPLTGGSLAPTPDPFERIPYASLFVRSEQEWFEAAVLEASDGERFCGFARSVALDETAAVVGDPLGCPDDSPYGAAYVYNLSSGKLGPCISDRIREHCNGLTGQERSDCVRKQQESCRERYGKD